MALGAARLLRLQRLLLAVVRVVVAALVARDERLGRLGVGGAPDLVRRLVWVLVDADTFNLVVRREVPAKARGHAAVALGVAAVVARAGAAQRAGRGEAPRRRHGRVEEDVHGLVGHLGPGELQSLWQDLKDDFAVEEPAQRLPSRRRAPLESVRVVLFEVRLFNGLVGRDGVGDVRLLLVLVLQHLTVEKRVDRRVGAVAEALVVPLALQRPLALDGAVLRAAGGHLQRSGVVRLLQVIIHRARARHGLDEVNLRGAAALVRVHLVVRVELAGVDLLLALLRPVALAVRPGPNPVRTPDVGGAR
mmetsp:Transcript_22305/g.75419  ORF Transcript_22305/g.75419 Transcript_22305/m.75419 type:complete len:305 (-) Transcript_22305:578-1492(-)